MFLFMDYLIILHPYAKSLNKKIMDNELNTNQEVEETQEQNTYVISEYIEQLRSKQSLPQGIIFGVAAAVIGAFLWAGITVATGYQIGYMAVAIGFIVGYAVRIGGQGVDIKFGIIGASMALLGCLLGNFFSNVAFIVKFNDIEYYEVLSALDFGMIVDIMSETFSPIDLLFYGIAIYEGYRFSFKKIA